MNNAFPVLIIIHLALTCAAVPEVRADSLSEAELIALDDAWIDAEVSGDREALERILYAQYYLIAPDFEDDFTCSKVVIAFNKRGDTRRRPRSAACIAADSGGCTRLVRFSDRPHRFILFRRAPVWLSYHSAAGEKGGAYSCLYSIDCDYDRCPAGYSVAG